MKQNIFLDYLRGRDIRNVAGVIKTDDGFGVPQEAADQILENLNLYSLARRFGAQVRYTTDGGKVVADIGTASEIAEGGSYAEAADPTTLTASLVKYGGRFSLTEEGVEDTIMDLIDNFTMAAGVALARKENSIFLVGTGTGEPTGIFSRAATSAAAATGAITLAELQAFDESIGAEWDGPESFKDGVPYTGPVYVMHPSTSVAIRDLDTGTEVDRIGRLRRLFGRPVWLSSDCPEMEASAKAVALVNWGAYCIMQRKEKFSMIVGVDHTTHDGTWDFSERIDGQTWDADGVKILAMASS